MPDWASAGPIVSSPGGILPCKIWPAYFWRLFIGDKKPKVPTSMQYLPPAYCWALHLALTLRHWSSLGAGQFAQFSLLLEFNALLSKQCKSLQFASSSHRSNGISKYSA